MRAKVPVEELDEETRSKLGLGDNNKQAVKNIVSPRLVSLGKVLQDLQGLDSRQAMWVLRKSIELLKGYRERVKKGDGRG